MREREVVHDRVTEGNRGHSFLCVFFPRSHYNSGPPWCLPFSTHPSSLGPLSAQRMCTQVSTCLIADHNKAAAGSQLQPAACLRLV